MLEAEILPTRQRWDISQTGKVQQYTERISGSSEPSTEEQREWSKVYTERSEPKGWVEVADEDEKDM
jgi:hypothetical protein